MKTKKNGYKQSLRKLQIELVALQRHIIRHDLRVLILFEGRDASGKDGLIKAISEHLSPRETRVVALGKPTERENRSWYFERHVAHLPADGEMVLFNRSWYNRAGVEKVMGFCTAEEYETFMHTVNDFEHLLIRSGTILLKYYLDISRTEQKQRLADRRRSPLTQWKISPIDRTALKHWKDYSEARDEMFARTHTEIAPWIVVKTDDKEVARLNVIRDILRRVKHTDTKKRLEKPDRNIVYPYPGPETKPASPH
jgi:polyphosphate kinase 2